MLILLVFFWTFQAPIKTSSIIIRVNIFEIINEKEFMETPYISHKIRAVVITKKVGRLMPSALFLNHIRYIWGSQAIIPKNPANFTCIKTVS